MCSLLQTNTDPVLMCRQHAPMSVFLFFVFFSFYFGFVFVIFFFLCFCKFCLSSYSLYILSIKSKRNSMCAIGYQLIFIQTQTRISRDRCYEGHLAKVNFCYMSRNVIYNLGQEGLVSSSANDDEISRNKHTFLKQHEFQQ